MQLLLIQVLFSVLHIAYLIGGRTIFNLQAYFQISSYLYYESFLRAVHNSHKAPFPRPELQAQSHITYFRSKTAFFGKRAIAVKLSAAVTAGILSQPVQTKSLVFSIFRN